MLKWILNLKPIEQIGLIILAVSIGIVGIMFEDAINEAIRPYFPHLAWAGLAVVALAIIVMAASGYKGFLSWKIWVVLFIGVMMIYFGFKYYKSPIELAKDSAEIFRLSIS